jgi:hypothetical protein
MDISNGLARLEPSVETKGCESSERLSTKQVLQDLTILSDAEQGVSRSPRVMSDGVGSHHDTE